MLPELADLLGTARVVSLPMRTRFRGITVREAVLFEGTEGWTEFSPFVEYDDTEAAAWLHGAIDFGWRAAPQPLRETIRVNAPSTGTRSPRSSPAIRVRAPRR
jgi:O-succinylbenzoate synthase